MTRDEIQAAIGLLAARFPATFFVFERRRKPIKLGIHLDLLAALGGAITPDELGHVLRFYCGNGAYLHTLVEGAARIDLDGNPCGTVTSNEATNAVARIAGAAKRAAARKQSRKAAQPEPPVQPVQPKRDGLAALRAAAAQRRRGVTA
jgi:ProP effector